MTIAEADAALTGPGGFFEIVTENVGGIDMGVVASPHRSLRDLLAASANHGGDGSARYYLFDDGRSATFAQNIDHAAAVTAALSHRYGIEPGDRVGLLGSNQPGWIQGFWGTVSAGAVAVAMNGWWKGDEIRYGIELTEPKVLIADRRRLERLDGDPGVPVILMDGDSGDPADRSPDTIDGLIDAYRGASLPDCEIAIDDPAAILFTSGTTGQPRGAIQTHRNFFAYLSCAFMIGARQFLRFPGETMDVGGPTLACSPLFHVSGLHACALMAVGAGFNHLWTTGRYDAEKILRLTEEHGIARWSGVTTQVWRLVEHPRLGDYDTSSVVSIGGGGSVWSPELQEVCRTALPRARISVTIGYGLTESSGLATSAADDVLRTHPDSVGYPLPTVGVRIADDDGVELPEGTVGNICLSGPMVTPGYWNDPRRHRGGHSRRLAAHRRLRLHPGRAAVPGEPAQRPHHPRRREHLPHRDRAAPRRAPRSGRVGRAGCGAPGTGPGGQGRGGRRGVAHRRLGLRTGILGGRYIVRHQGSGPLGVADRAAAPERHRQDPQASRSGRRRLRLRRGVAKRPSG